MIDYLPIVYVPEVWTLCFARHATTRWRSFLAFGYYKHVRAYAYVPGMKAWLFYDTHISGKTVAVVPDGDDAMRIVGRWITKADLIRIRRNAAPVGPPIFGWCVPAIRHLIGARSCALRPTALYRWCLRHGGEPFEGLDGRTTIPAAGD